MLKPRIKTNNSMLKLINPSAPFASSPKNLAMHTLMKNPETKFGMLTSRV